MEQTPERKYLSKNLTILLSGVLLLLIITNWVYLKKANNLEDQIIQLSGKNALVLDSVLNNSRQIDLKYRNELRIKDSLEKELLPIQPYRALVGMLSFRDSVQMALPFKIGEKVTYLPDSTSAYVNEVRITGSGYSFGVYYLLVFKGGIEKVVPSHLIAKP
jgi:hypothetical protein